MLTQLLSEKIDYIDHEASLQGILDKMTEEHSKHFVLLKNNKPIGIITERDILSLYAKHVNLEQKAINFANQDLITSHINRKSNYVLGLMLNHKVRRIIIVDDNKEYLGSILQEKIIFEFEQDIFKTNIKAKDLIREKLKATYLEKGSTIQEALDLMEERAIGSVLVYDNDKPIGILTESDIISLAQKHTNTDQQIQSFASKKLVSFNSEESLFDIVKTLREKDIRRAIIFDESNNDYYIITAKEILNNLKGNYNLFLESKLKDAKEAFNSLNEAVIELFDDGKTQTVYWLNKKAKDIFDIKIDDCITDIILKPRWELLYKKILDNNLEDKEIIEIGNNTFQLAIISGKVMENSIIKLLFTNISEIVNKGQAIENQFKLLYDEVPYPYQSLDSKGIIKSVNKKWLQITGYEKNEVIGQSFLDFTNDKTQAKEYLNDLLQEGHIEKQLLEIVKKNNQIILASFTSTVSNIDGRVNTHCIFKDITKEHFMQRKLQLSDIVFEHTNEGIIITNEKVQIISINKSFTRITGYDLQEVKGRNPKILKSGKQSLEFYKLLWTDLNTKGSWEGEIWNKNKYGLIYPQWLNINSVKNQNGYITNYVALFSDITQIKKSTEKMEFLANHDALTHLPNRNLFMKKLENAITYAKESSKKLALFFIDIDKFKTINDTYGHEVGDEIIINVAQKLKNKVRRNDTVARLGGDEFVMIIENISNIEDINKIAEKITKDFQNTIHLKNHNLNVTLSIGISIFPDDTISIDDLIKYADLAMYNSKSNGRNQFVFYNNGLLDKFSEKIKVRDTLVKALNQEEFDVYYQPLFDINSNQIIGAEALVRWNKEKDGLVLPSEFIKDAEDSKLIIPIGKLVIKKACSFMKKLNDLNLLKDGLVSINLSNVQMKDSNIVDEIKEELKNSGLKSENLEIEITEKYILEDIDNSLELLEELKELGIKISIHNFGTGYLSLNHLKKLPIDKLKIDKSFIQTIPEDKKNAEIIKSLINLDDALNLKTFAEGIELKEQKEFLEKEGCAGAQGWYYSEALNENDFIKYLEESN